MKKVIVAHPGKQHSFQTATALKEHGLLLKYVTTVYDKKFSLLYFLKQFLKGKAFKKALSRKCDALEDNDVKLFCSLGGLSIIALAKLNLNRKYKDRLIKIVHQAFARKVALYALRHKADAVIMYDSNVYDAFDILKKNNPEIICILDATIASRSYMKKLYEKDMQLYPDEGLKKEQLFLWKQNLSQRYDREFRQADYIFAGSEFVKQSITNLIKDPSKIFIIPYGVNIRQFHNTQRNFEQSPLRLLFVGGVSRRKGIHHLLKVVSCYSSKEVILEIAGAFDSTDSLYKKYHDRANISFFGFVTRNQIANVYAQSHLFILPSIAEGMAMVGLEALASGLPVLCTYNAGLSVVVKNGYNGFNIPASDEKALQDRIDWFINHKKEMSTMSTNAERSAQGYSWENYRTHVASTLKQI